MITAEEVKFDQFGQWQHSAIHALGEEFDEVPFKDIPAFNGLRMKVIRVWDEEDQNRLGGYPNSNLPADFRTWQPEPPDGDGLEPTPVWFGTKKAKIIANFSSPTTFL